MNFSIIIIKIIVIAKWRLGIVEYVEPVCDVCRPRRRHWILKERRANGPPVGPLIKSLFVQQKERDGMDAANGGSEVTGNDGREGSRHRHYNEFVYWWKGSRGVRTRLQRNDKTNGQKSTQINIQFLRFFSLFSCLGGGICTQRHRPEHTHTHTHRHLSRVVTPLCMCSQHEESVIRTQCNCK